MSTPTNPDDDLIPLSEKIGYGMGDFAANLVFQTQLMFLLNYYTDVYGIGAAVAGSLLAFARVVDAFNDLVMGTLADRTVARWRGYRPWLLLTALPLGLSFYLAFVGPPFSQTGKIIWAAITLLSMVVIYGANNIPYSALGGTLSADPEQRVSIASWRFNLAMFGTFLVQTFTLSMIRSFGGENSQSGYRIAVGIWALLAVAGALVAFYATKERRPPSTQPPLMPGKNLLLLVRTRSWLALAAASLLLYVCLAVRGSVMLYYFQHALQREDWFGSFNAVGIACAMIGIFCSPYLARLLGKRNAFVAGMLCSGTLTSGFFYTTADHPYSLFTLQIVYQIAFGATIPLLWGMIADVADLVECRTHLRITAFTFAATLFCFKIGLGLGIAGTGWLLDLVEYRPQGTQLPGAIHGIRILVSFLPGFLLACSAACLTFFEISQERERTLSEELRSLRAEK